MNKREFLKGTGSALAGAAIARIGHAQMSHNTAPAQGARTNWSGNYTFKAAHMDDAASPEAVQKLVSGLSHAKALGSRHSFNDIADTSGDQITVSHLNGMTIDREAGTATLGGGVRYSDLAPWLDAQGFALPNLASLLDITLAGACSTATHGSGIHNRNLSSVATAIDFVDGTGQLRTLSRAANPDEFPGAVVGLGALGIILRTTVHVVPSFRIAQIVYENLSFDQLEHNLDAIFSAGYSVSLFTDWQHHRATQAWLKQSVAGNTRPQMPPLFYGATLQKTKLHPLVGHSTENTTEQMGVPGPWYDRLPHFRLNFTPSSGAELQSEYLIPRSHAFQAILAVEELRDRITPHLFITELRTIAADDLWMSTAYQRDSFAIHFTWKPEWDAVRSLLPLIEAKLEPFDARPHWGKLNTVPSARLKQLYPRYADFQRLMTRYDPQGKFRNQYLDNVFRA